MRRANGWCDTLIMSRFYAGHIVIVTLIGFIQTTSHITHHTQHTTCHTTHHTSHTTVHHHSLLLFPGLDHVRPTHCWWLVDTTTTQQHDAGNHPLNLQISDSNLWRIINPEWLFLSLIILIVTYYVIGIIGRPRPWTLAIYIYKSTVCPSVIFNYQQYTVWLGMTVPYCISFSLPVYWKFMNIAYGSYKWTMLSGRNSVPNNT